MLTSEGKGMSRTKKGIIALIVTLAIGGMVWLVAFSIDSSKDSKLLEACRRCDAAEVEHLLEKGADPNAQRKTFPFLTALMFAVSCDKANTVAPWSTLQIEPVGDPKVVKLLLDKGADVNKRTRSPYTALHYAVGNPETNTELEGPGPHPHPAPGNPEITKMLLAAGADANAESRYGIAPLGRAMRSVCRQTKWEF
jgi:ankyrin repeat protein